MLQRIGSMPPGNDPAYVPQDTLCKEVYDLSTQLKYYVTKLSENGNDDGKTFNIDPRNMITASYLNFARTCFCKCSHDIVTNCCAHISKTKKIDKQTQKLQDISVPSNRNLHAGFISTFH